MKNHPELPPVEEVRLHPFLGMRPGVYILILTSLVVVVAIFVIGFLPGILRGGRYVDFTTDAANVGVTVDGTYLGGLPYQYWLSSGEHELTFTKAGVEIARDTVTIDHPVFFTWLVHRHRDYELDIHDLDNLQKRTIARFDLAEIERLSAITTFDAVTVYAPVFTDFAHDAVAFSFDKQAVSDDFALATAFITSEEMKADANEAATFLEEHGIVISPLANSALAFAEDLFGNVKSERVGKAASTPSMTVSSATLEAETFVQDGIVYPRATFTMGDRTDAIFPETNEMGIETTTEPFVIARTPVSEYQWALFIEENPQWDKGNAATLKDQGLVDDQYLSGLVPSVVFATAKPVHNISYRAAQAFCTWLEQKTGKEVFIPTEAQWTQAALSVQDKSYARTLTAIDDDTSRPTAMLGGVWEFTSTPYIPLARAIGYERLGALYEEAGLQGDVIVKGGSYLNNPSSVTIQTIGAVDRSSCGDQIGFRIAWNQ